jgi:hypothetical protein
VVSVWNVLSVVIAGLGVLIAGVAMRNARNKERVTGLVEEQRRLDAQETGLRLAREEIQRIDQRASSALDAALARVADLEAGSRVLSDELHRIDTRESSQVAGMAEKLVLLEKGQEKNDRAVRDLADLEGRVGVLDKQIEVFWRNVAIDVSKILHSPHEGWEELDALLDKLRASLDEDGPELSQQEMSTLEGRLTDMVEGNWEAEATRTDRALASWMLRAIQQSGM